MELITARLQILDWDESDKHSSLLWCEINYYCLQILDYEDTDWNWQNTLAYYRMELITARLQILVWDEKWQTLQLTTVCN